MLQILHMDRCVCVVHLFYTRVHACTCMYTLGLMPSVYTHGLMPCVLFAFAQAVHTCVTCVCHVCAVKVGGDLYRKLG